MYNQQTPIDIHCSKLVDWLVQRRHCKKDWGENLASIRRKIRVALGDMPENEDIKELLIGSKLDYFKSKQIVEILKTSESSSKNIFGYYTSQRMKDWQDIVYCYEKDYIYLAETATDLIRETNYEVPGIRKLINNLKKEEEEAEKEKANLLRKAQQFTSEHQKLVQTYEIDSQTTLTMIMEEVLANLQELNNHLEYYQTFSSSVTKQDPKSFASMLKYILSKGNTTFYEYKYDEAPDKIDIVEETTNLGTTSNLSALDMVDDEIDFGEDLPSSDSSNGFVHLDKGSDSNNEETYIKVEKETVRDKIARGEEAKPVLLHRKTRNLFLNNLYELEAFYTQLSIGLDQNSTADRSFLLSESYRSPKYNMEELSQITGKIRHIIAIMNSDKNKFLFQISDSPSFVDSIKEKLEKKAKQAADTSAKASLLDDKIVNIENQKRETEIHLKKCIMSAKELQHKVESSLREIYGGRAINIMGCVN